MKKFILITAACLMVLALLAGCGDSQSEQPISTEPFTESGTELKTEPTPPTETEGDTQNQEPDFDAIDPVYGQQIRRYYTAISQQWDKDAYLDQDMSPLAAAYYEGNPMDNIGFTVMDLNGDDIGELIIGAIQNGEKDPLVLEIWTVQNNEPLMLAQSGYHNRYYLQYSEEDGLWSVAYEAENGAANHAVYYLQLLDGEFGVVQGVVFDAAADENAPWFMTYDLDGDVSNDTPIDESIAQAVMEAGRNIYTAAEYSPYSLYQ